MKNRDIALTDAQRSMVEANMDVVRWVIRTSIQVNEQRYGFGYDRASDLEIIGYNILAMPRSVWSRLNQVSAA